MPNALSSGSSLMRSKYERVFLCAPQSESSLSMRSFYGMVLFLRQEALTGACKLL